MSTITNPGIWIGIGIAGSIVLIIIVNFFLTGKWNAKRKKDDA